MTLFEQLQQKINAKAKPLGSLGMLEQIALQAGIIQSTTCPKISDPHIVVFAGDHGIATSGLVNAYPQEITAIMVNHFVRGVAAINGFCKLNDIELVVVDAGVNADLGEIEGVIINKIAYGTANYLYGDAMSAEQAELAISRGREVVRKILKQSKCNCIGFGDMGISNSSSAALIMSAVTHLPLEDCVGRGAGASDEQMARKVSTLKAAYAHHRLDENNISPVEILRRVGGYEIAMMTGAYIEAYVNGMMIIVDGFISTSALLLGQQMESNILANCIFAHQSGESGHRLMLDYLNAKPILNLGMRLGEGTGAALAIPLIRCAISFIEQMAELGDEKRN